MMKAIEKRLLWPLAIWIFWSGVSLAEETVPEPEMPSVVDGNYVNVTTGTISLTHRFGNIGPQRRELMRSGTYQADGSGFNWSESAGILSTRDSIEDFEIFYDDDDGSYGIASDKTHIKFGFSFTTNEFTPMDATIATLENVSGTDNFTDLIFTAPDGAVYTFDAFASGAILQAYDVSRPMAHLKSIERPNGEIWTNERVPEGELPGSLRFGFRSGNLGYSVYPYLTNLGYTRCETTSCTEYDPNDWPDKQHDPGPTVALSDPFHSTHHLGGGDTEILTRYPYALIEYANGDTVRVNFDVETLSDGGWQSSKSRVTSVERYGLVWTYEYETYPVSSSGRRTTITAPDGSKERFSSENDDNKVTKIEKLPSGTGSAFVTTFAYLGDRLGTITYPEGNQTVYGYDSVGRITEVRKIAKPGSTEPDFVTSYTYDDCITSNRNYCAYPRTFSDERGYITTYTYSAVHGGVTEIEAPDVTGYGIRKTNIEYGQFHAWYRTSSSATQVKDDRAVWRRTKDLSCVVNTPGVLCLDGTADVQVKEYFYEQGDANTPSNINLIQTVSRAGDNSVSQTVDITYDTWGRVIAEDGPLSGTADKVWNEYNKRNYLTRATGADPDGAGPQGYAYTRYEYNLEDQVTLEETGWTTSELPASRVDTPLNSKTHAFDSYGRPSKTTALDGASGAVALTQISYDSVGRFDCAALRMDVSTYASLPSSACSQTAGGEDRITKTTYDLFSRPYKITRAFNTAAEMSEETGFTDNGLTATRTDANGNVTTFEYDGLDRLIKTRYPNKTGPGSSTTDYDAWTFITANGNSTTLEATRRYRDGNTVSYQYDALARLVMTDAPGTQDDVSITYDTFGNIATEAKDGETLTYTFDALGRFLSEAQSLGTVAYEYDGAGRRTKTTYPDGFFVTYDYAGAAGVEAIKENGSAALASYTYDAFGRGVQTGFGNGVQKDFGFDPAGLLASYDFVLPLDSSYTQRADFGYNVAAQITSLARSNASYVPGLFNETRTYNVNGLNQLTDENGVSFSYDDRGSLTGDTVETYVYDIYNQLTGVDAHTLDYDAAGRLTRFHADDGSLTQFLYDGTSLIAEYDGAGTLLRRYVHGASVDAPVVWYEGAAVTSQTRRYLVPDERGSIVLVTDDAGLVLQQNKYDPYGEPDPGNLGRFQYTGQMWLDGTGLYHYKARAYSPRLGRFLQTDPIGYEDGLNWYAYVGNDPMNFVDPYGNYGRGSGFSEPEWLDFDNLQKQTASDMEATADFLEADAELMLKSDDTEAAEALIEAAEGMLEEAESLRAGADALRGDEYQVNVGDLDGGDFAEVNYDTGIMTLDTSHRAWKEREKDPILVQFAIGHESIHSGGLKGHATDLIRRGNRRTAYRFGSPGERNAYANIKVGGSRARRNPDHLMSRVYP